MFWLGFFILVVFLVFGGADFLIDMGIKVFGKKDKRKLESHEYEWGNGKDLSGLMDSKAIESSDFPSILADTTWARVEAEWRKDNPTEEQRFAEKAAELEAQYQKDREYYKELVASKSKAIAKLMSNNEDLRESVNAYRKQLAQPSTVIEFPKGMAPIEAVAFRNEWYKNSGTRDLLLDDNAWKLNSGGSVPVIPGNYDSMYERLEDKYRRIGQKMIDIDEEMGNF